MKWIVWILYGVFLASLFLAGAVATETRMLLQWPSFVGFGALGVLLVIRWKPKLTSAPADLCMGAAALFVGYVVVRGLMSPVAYFARQDISLVLACFAVYLLTATHFSSPKMRAGTVWVLLLLGLGNLLVGLVHLSGDWGFHILAKLGVFPLMKRGFEEGRIGGFFNNSDHLAAFMLVVLFVSLGMALYGRGSGVRRSVFGILGAISVAVILFSKSRGGMIGVVAGMGALGTVVLCFVWTMHRYLFGRVAAGMAVVALVGGGVFLFAYGKVVDSRFKGGGPPREDVRLHFWTAAWDQHLENPVFGTGSRTYSDYCRKYRTAELHPSVGDAEFAHSEYFQLLGDYGWAGVGLFLLLILLHLRNGFGYLRWFAKDCAERAGTAQGSRLGMAVGALVALVALLVHAAVEFHMHIPAVALGASFCLGVMANPGMGRGAPRPVRLPAFRPILKLGLAGAGGWLVFAGWSYQRAEVEYRRAELMDVVSMPNERLGLLHRVVEADPEHFKAFALAANTRLDMMTTGMPPIYLEGLAGLAIADFERAVELEPNDAFIRMDFADALAAVGRGDEAGEQLQAALEWAPLYENMRLAWAMYLHRTGRFEEANAAYLAAKEATAYKNTNWWVGHRQLVDDMREGAPAAVPPPVSN